MANPEYHRRQAQLFTRLSKVGIDPDTTDLGPNPRQIENAGNGAHQVIIRQDFFEIQRIEQLPWSRLLRPIIAAPPIRISMTESLRDRTFNEFCNKIGQEATCKRCTALDYGRGNT
jgi:hypothetical protein